jgi:hypothetical protein
MTEQEITDRIADENAREQIHAAGLMAQAKRGLGYYAELAAREGPPQPTLRNLPPVIRYDADSGDNIIILPTGKRVSESDYYDYYGPDRYGD